MNDDDLLSALLAADGDARVAPHQVAASTRVSVLVVVAVLTDADGPLATAASHATTTRDRRLVVLAGAHLTGDDDRFDALVRDHLVEHPDHVVASWLAAVHTSRRTPTH